MKPLVEWRPGEILALSWLPSLAFTLLTLSEPYDSPDRFMFSLLGDVWYMGGYAVYLAAIALALSNKLTADRQEPALADSLRFLVVYIILPILALFRPFSPSLLPSLLVEHPLLMLGLSMLCYLYPAYFTAKYLTTVEQGRPTSFRENVSTCLALSFFPLSVFFIQPRVQAAIHSDPAESDSLE